ncbi:hypothetical protein HMPREF3293_00359 [Christensenella minuta]|uniref:Uncharacterized protein n=1 Tax=Christensenella minuta TaxID=626937 RepID=A0A136Q803_9FIRM|nr:hypothetical protein HMPREF3293_00359 [Christensenella minuta]
MLQDKNLSFTCKDTGMFSIGFYYTQDYIIDNHLCQTLAHRRYL